MKLISNCERKFVSSCIIKRQKRLDGRDFFQGRTLEIVFGKERGCCIVLQGNTRVLVQVSCDVSEPKASAPAVGIFHVNLELSSMAGPDANSYSRTSEEFVEAQRTVERCIRDSKCIDLESLCIIPASKVWSIRVDIHALNDDGNLTECATIAAISALSHFRRPEVTAIGTDVIVHSIEDKKPVALNLRHMPISINLAVFDQGKYILVDPNDIEETVCDGCYIIGINAHQEICFVHRQGVLLLTEEILRKCEDVAIKRAQEVTQIIRSALDDDAYKRATHAPIGYTNLIQSGTILGAKRQTAQVSFDSIRNLPEENEADTEVKAEVIEPTDEITSNNDMFENSETETKRKIGDSSRAKSKGNRNKKLMRALKILEDSEAAVFEGGRNKWGVDTDGESSEEEVSGTNLDMSIVKNRNSDSEEEVSGTNIDMSVVKKRNSDSEEETVYINKEQLDVKASNTRGWFTKDPF